MRDAVQDNDSNYHAQAHCKRPNCEDWCIGRRDVAGKCEIWTARQNTVSGGALGAEQSCAVFTPHVTM